MRYFSRLLKNVLTGCRYAIRGKRLIWRVNALSPSCRERCALSRRGHRARAVTEGIGLGAWKLDDRRLRGTDAPYVTNRSAKAASPRAEPPAPPFEDGIRRGGTRLPRRGSVPKAQVEEVCLPL